MTAPLAINWNYSYYCTLNCDHCYSRNRKEKELCLEDKYKVAENIIKNQVFIVNIGGGEPILCDDIYEIITYLSKNNIRVSLSTNGWFIDDIRAEKLKHSGLSQVSISIDNANPEKHDKNRGKSGCFQKAVEAAKRCVDLGMEVVFSTTMTSENFEVLKDILDLASSLNIQGVDFKRIKISGNASEHLYLELTKLQESQLYDNMVTWKGLYPMLDITMVYGEKIIPGLDDGCPCGRISLCITSNGDVSPCVYNVTSILGNAIYDDLSDIWINSKELKYLRENFKCMGLLKRK